MAELASIITPVISMEMLTEKIKSKQFRWDSGIIENLIKCLQSYKTQMEYKNLDFDGNRHAQYSSLRDEMSKIVSLFGPISLLPASSSP